MISNPSPLRLASIIINNVRREFHSATAPHSQPVYTLWRWGSAGRRQGLFKTLMKKNPTAAAAAAVETSKQLSISPTKVEGFEDQPIDFISAGFDHAAVIVDGRVFTFGNNEHGQLGRPSSVEPSLDPGPVKFPHDDVRICQVACGGYHTAALANDGRLYTWGWGGTSWSGAGALGLGQGVGNVKTPQVVQKLVDHGEHIVEVACGSQHTVALSSSGRIFSTGEGEMGRLGTGDTQDRFDFEEIDFFCAVKPPVEIAKIRCGTSHTTALLTNGEVFVWGGNESGQLGLEDSMGDMFTNESFPRRLPARSGVDQIMDVTCGEKNTFILTVGGDVEMYGSSLWLNPRLVMPASVAAHLEHDPLVKIVPGGSKNYFCYGLTSEAYCRWEVASACSHGGIMVAKVGESLRSSFAAVDAPTAQLFTTMGQENCRCILLFAVDIAAPF